MSASDAEPGSPSAGPWPGKAYPVSEITVYFDAQRCRHSGECLRGLPEVFDGRQRPWIAPGAASAALVAEVIRRCPSGALHYQAPGISREQ
ncbi:MAG: (4Fe-4S)-binding protein, partial [Streptosporangiaceae bacterium]